MSATTDLQALLSGSPALARLVGTRIVSDRAEAEWPRPFLVYSGSAAPDYTLTNEAVATMTTFSLQCCADTRKQAEAVADAVQAALDLEAIVVDRSTGFSQNLDVELVTLTVEWWDA